MMSSERFFLTSLGMVNALGDRLDTIARSLWQGDTRGLSPVEGMVPERTIPLGRVTSVLPDLPAALEPFRSRNLSLLWGAYRDVAATVEAAKARFGRERIGVVIGASAQGIDVGEAAYAHFLTHGDVPPGYQYSQQELGSAAEALALAADLAGPAYSVGTACSSSANAFGSARNLLAAGLCDAVVVGGVDALCRLTVRGFASLEAVSSRVCNPMSRNRDGISLGEGAALFVMTREGPGVELWGVGASCDAHHISSPHPEGEGAEAAMRAALSDADLPPDAIDYINLHGTGTLHNDAMESKAVVRLFGSETPCSSTKPLTGHSLGAAGATEVGFCWLVLSQGGGALPLPPHRWDGERDPDLPPLQLVAPGRTIPRRSTTALLSNSFAFGGNNCAVILGKRA